ncbi:MAG: glucose-6-phosphate dehydrogenase assembly protein OpcA [Solirubrobacteraceae bacterium]
MTAEIDEDVWSAQDTTPSAIEAALRSLLAKRHQSAGAVAPARVLNLVVVCDRAYRGEIENRLERVGRFHASRTILCAVDHRRTKLSAWASMATQRDGRLSVARERVEVDMGERHLATLQTIVAPLVISDLATVVWAPHGHAAAEDALRELAQVVLVDSLDDDVEAALDRVHALQEDLYVVDLAWLRSTPWRERIAAAFDPPEFREELRRVCAVTIRHRADSVAPAALLAGWLASRLDWTPGPLTRRDGALVGRATGRREDVRITLEPVEQPEVPGLAGVTIESASGASVALDRAPGGLCELRRARDGGCRQFTVMGASRGEGVRQALLRDRTYRPALGAARRMVGR